MDILEHVSLVRTSLDEDFSSAVRRMTDVIEEFLTPEALEYARGDEHLAEMFALIEGEPAIKGVDQLAGHVATAHKHTKEAHRVHADAKASKEAKADAHFEAERAHMFAAIGHEQAGKKREADHHYKMADHHSGHQDALLGTKHEEGDDQPYVSRRAHAASAKATEPHHFERAIELHRFAALSASKQGDRVRAMKHIRAARDMRDRAGAKKKASNEWIDLRGIRRGDAALRSKSSMFATGKKKMKHANEAVSDAAKALHQAHVNAHVAKWRAEKLKAKLAAPKSARTPMAPAPKKPIGEWGSGPGKRVNKPIGKAMCPCPGEKGQPHPVTHDPDFDYSQPAPKMCPCPEKPAVPAKSVTHDPEEHDESTAIKAKNAIGAVVSFGRDRVEGKSKLTYGAAKLTYGEGIIGTGIKMAKAELGSQVKNAVALGKAAVTGGAAGLVKAGVSGLATGDLKPSGTAALGVLSKAIKGKKAAEESLRSMIDGMEIEESDDPVGQASSAAKKASQVALGAGGTDHHHETAVALHGIAHNVAKVHGNAEKADWHLNVMNKHKSKLKGAAKAG